MKRSVRSSLLALLVIAFGSVALAATQYGLGQIVVDSTSANQLTIRTPSGSGVTVTLDMGMPDQDEISMGPGSDRISFGPNDGSSASLVFDAGPGSSLSDDTIVFDANGDTDPTNDRIRVRSDQLELQSNSGDVIAQLGP